MDKELKEGLIAVLEEGIKAQIPDRKEIKGVLTEDEYAKCFNLLWYEDQVILTEGYGFHTSLAGREYLEYLKHRNIVWCRKNWFPVAVAIVAAGVGIASIIV